MKSVVKTTTQKWRGSHLFKPILILFIVCIQDAPAFSQAQDTIDRKDSAFIYKKIQAFAYRRKITKWMFQGVFREIAGEVAVVSRKGKPVIPKKEGFKSKQGMNIRKIHIITIDPFGRVQGDTIAVEGSGLERAGNRLHVKSTRKNIQDQLLFQEGDPLDSMKLIESERLLRSTSYISEAKIKAEFTSQKKDSLDVYVTVRDLWSIDGSAGISPSTNSMEFSERNFLGLGHQIKNAISLDLQSSSDFTSEGSYVVPNINRSYVSGSVFYHTSDNDKGYGLSFNRGFFSPLTRWAGGLTLSTNHSRLPFIEQDGSTVHYSARNYAEDVWIGRGFNIKNTRFEAYRDPRLLITARVYNLQYIHRPPFEYDTLKNHRGNTFYLSSISLSTRNYYKDVNIYNFGRIEDVPEGRFLALIGGVQFKEFSTARPYAGFVFSHGKHIESLGYLAINLEYGGFIERNSTQEGVINAGFHFFNDLWTYRKWKMRQFVTFQLTDGLNRRKEERITINAERGIDGFRSDVLTGVDKGVLTLANVVYMPYKWVGFQFAPFVFASFAGIGETTSDLLKDKIYQGYGIGVMIRNEFLVVRTIQISFGFYPEIPGVGRDVYKFNSLKVSNLRFGDIYFSKPEFISYD